MIIPQKYKKTDIGAREWGDRRGAGDQGFEQGYDMRCMFFFLGKRWSIL